MNTSIIIKDIEIFVERDDKVVTINEAVEIPDGLEQELVANYPVYEIWFMYHNTPAPIERLKEISVLLDDCIDMRLWRDNFKPGDVDDVFQAATDDESYAKFAEMHDKVEDMFWTSSRIRDNIQHWGVFMSQPDPDATGYTIICTNMSRRELAEVFCLRASHIDQTCALLTAAVQYAFANGKTEVVFMVDKNSKFDTAKEQEAALSVGFTVAGSYQGYRLNAI